MGLGKTYIALATLAAGNLYPAVILCPANLKLMWVDTIKKVLPNKTYRIISGGNKLQSVLYGREDITIINYDILHKHLQYLSQVDFKCIIADEGHSIRSDKAKKTLASIALAKNIPYKYVLTGTLIVNQVRDLVTILRFIDRLKEFGGEKAFLKRFNHIGANLKYLHTLLTQRCYIRADYSAAGIVLPPKNTNVITLDINNRPIYEQVRDNLIKWLRVNISSIAANNASRAEQIVRINYLKQICAYGKLNGINKWLKDYLSNKEQMIIYADHISIQKALLRMVPNSLSILGGISIYDSDIAKKKFIDGDNQVLIASLRAASMGHTFTNCHNISFVELGWNAMIHDQAEARVHRMTQEKDVNIFYFLGRNTIDENIWGLIESKRIKASHIIDGLDPQHSINFVDALVSKFLGVS